MGQTDEALIDEFNRILSRHDFIFVDDYYWGLLAELFP